MLKSRRKKEVAETDETEVESGTEVDDALEELRAALEELEPKEVAAKGDDGAT